MNVLVLGAQGFLGRRLVQDFHRLGTNVCSIVRGASEVGAWLHGNGCRHFGSRGAPCNPDVVVNVAASWKSKSESELRTDNFDFPLSVLKALATSPRRWIQTNSFFNYAFDMSGVDLDSYSYWRRKTAEHLVQTAGEEGFEYSEIRLPHLLGGSVNRPQMIPSLIRALQRGLRFRILHPGSFLPVVDVLDAARQLRLLSDTRHRVLSRELAWTSGQMTVLETAVRVCSILGADSDLLQPYHEKLPAFPANRIVFPEASSLVGAAGPRTSFEQTIRGIAEELEWQHNKKL